MIKRVFDLVVSAVGIIIIIPLMIIVSIAVKLEFPQAGVLFKQRRVGKNGKLFTLYKIRTMVPSDCQITISIKGDNRITKVGAFLRKYKIDELPALINVFLGQMSVVGPRPDVPGYADKLKDEERKILEMRPGITGPASLYYANEEEILAGVEDPIFYNDNVIYPDKVRINLDYYYSRTFWGDIKIIANTIFRKY